MLPGPSVLLLCPFFVNGSDSSVAVPVNNFLNSFGLAVVLLLCPFLLTGPTVVLLCPLTIF